MVEQNAQAPALPRRSTKDGEIIDEKKNNKNSLQTNIIALLEVLGHSALHCSTCFQLQREGLGLCRATGHVADTIFPSHCAAMSNFNL